MAFIFVQPDDALSRAESIEPFVRGAELRLQAADLDGLGVSAGLTGMPRYALDDRDVIQHDVSRLSLVSVGLVLLLCLLGFGSFRRPMAAVAASGDGSATQWSSCWTPLAQWLLPGGSRSRVATWC